MTNMNSTTIPILRYQDAEKAIAWLCKAFGFTVFLKVNGDAERIEHARLTLNGNMIMLASTERKGEFERNFKSPLESGCITQSVAIVVPEVDQIYRSAVAAGARILDDLADSRFGGKMFS